MPRKRKTKTTMKCLWMAALLVASLATQARSDILYMKSGQKIEGKIVSENSGTVEVDTKFGRMAFERIKIDRIEYQRLPKEEVAHRRKAAGTDPRKLYEVALFAKENKLMAEYKQICQDVVRVDQNHKDANEALGKKYYDGQWFTPEELEKHIKFLTMQMKEQGKVLYKGKWVKEETAKRLEGFELYKGQWLRWKEIYTLQAQEKMPELLGTMLEIRDSEHFTLRSNLSEDGQKEILELLEEGYEHFTNVFKPTEKEAYIMGFYPIAVYILPDPTFVTKFVEEGSYMDQLYNPPRGINERYLDANSFPVFFPRPLIITSGGRHLKGGGSRYTSQIGFITHYAGNLMVRRLKRGGKVPGWVESGLSHYYEGMLNGYQTLSITEYVGYEHIEKWDIALQTFPKWYKKLADPEFRRSLPRIADFQEKIVEILDAHELVKAYFVTQWLMETKQKQYADYVRAAYLEKPGSRQRTPEPMAFKEAFQMTPEEMEEEFEAWAARQPPRPPT